MNTDETAPSGRKLRTLWFGAFGGLLVLFSYVFLVNAWVVDDAYITFRTVDNFVHGYGLRWNVDERVQVFTHPLWTFVIIVFYFLTGEVFFTSIVVCYLLCIGTLAVAYSCLTREPGGSLWKPSLLVLLLIGSKAFMDYTSAGLENALSYLLAVLFYAKFLFGGKHPRDLTRKETAWLCFLASLAFANRQDTLALYVPALAYLLWVHFGKGKRRTSGIVLAATLPASLWLLFAVFYFGFPYPNTAYAKLFSASIPFSWKLLRGVEYFGNSLRWDTPSHLAVLAALILAWRERSAPLLLALGGVFLYELYIFTSAASATHMSGRFFSVPFFIGALVFVYGVRSPKVAVAAAAIVVMFNVVHPFASFKMGTRFYMPCFPTPRDFDTKWEVFTEGAALLNYRRGKTMPDHLFYHEGLRVRKSDKRVHVGGPRGGGAIGYFGFAAGPEKHIIDYLGLGDPLLARLPSRRPPSREEYLPGHFIRDIPEGYVESVETGRNLIKSEPLRAYYEKLRNITRGPLCSWSRLRDIWEMNLGRHNHLIEEYQKSLEKDERAVARDEK